MQLLELVLLVQFAIGPLVVAEASLKGSDTLGDVAHQFRDFSSSEKDQDYDKYNGSVPRAKTSHGRLPSLDSDRLSEADALSFVADQSAARSR